jgi:predicted ATPase/predicted negative regulator of RcsB-dependent stress response
VALYGGDFLAGFSLPSCPQFEWWLLSQQELYHRQVLETLARLGAYYESYGDYHQSSSYAQKEIELEPWRETAHRRRMRTLALSGERSQALRQYESCRAILAQEMGIEPSRQTTELFEIIRAGDALSMEDAQPTKEIPGALPPRSSIPTPSAAPFVGFEPELAQLERHLAAALSGRARVAFIAGEAGSGKTTLLAEFIGRALDAHGDLLAAVGGCSTQFGYGDPYLPFRQALHLLTGDLEGIWSAGALGEEHAGRIWSALPFVLETLLAEGPDLVGTLLPLETLQLHIHKLGDKGAEAIAKLESQAERRTGELSAPASQSRQMAIFDQFTRVLLAVARRCPLILALDDLQWADRGSLSLLFHLARNLGNSRVLVVGAYRPEEIVLDQRGERHPMQTLVNELMSQFGEMRIDLSQAAGWDFVNALLDSESNDLDAAFRRKLFQLTEGHPLFTVEQLRAMQESGGLVRDEAGRWAAGGELNWERIPARVEAIIAERLARPSVECRALLDAASVQGETFSAETLAVVLEESETDIVERLSGELCRQHRLVFAQGLQRLGDTTRSRYRFRHALYQRQLYQNLDAVLRARLHQATGEALERRYTQQTRDLTLADASAPRLAFHFEKAGLLEKAIQYHQKAGEQAYRLAANEDAISHYNRALELLKSAPESGDQIRQELLLLLSLSGALIAARGYAEPELRRLYARAGELAAKGDEVDLFSHVLYLRGIYHYARAEYQSTLDMGEQLLGQFLDQSILWMSDIANFLLGIGRLNMGDLTLAQAHLQKIKAVGDSDQVNFTTSPIDRDRLLFPIFLSWTLWLLGYPDQAFDLNQQLLSRVRKMGYPYYLAVTLGTSSCVIHVFRSEFGQLQEQAQELIDLSTKKGFGLYRAWGKIFLGRAQVEVGNIEVGLANLQAGLDAFRATGHIHILTLMLAVQAEAFAIVGQNDDGLKILSEALRLANETGERFYEAELHRLRGELLLAASGGEDEVEACFQKALQVAHEQEAKSLELRAATSLAQLWARQGKANQAGQMLGEVYKWFSEGFDTPDLQEARSLMQELAERSSIER